MTAPKFKIGDHVKWKDFKGRAHSGIVHGYEFFSKRWRIADSLTTFGWWPESHLSLDIQETPKFKIGDRVKYHGLDGDALGHINGIETSAGKSQYYIKGVPGLYQESSLSLDVPAEPKFKVGNWVNYTPCGLSGFITQVNADDSYTIDAGDRYILKIPSVDLSLAVPEPKQFATSREVELGAEIITLHEQIATQRKENAFMVSKMTAEIGSVHRERKALESAQKIMLRTGDLLHCERRAREEAQRELAEARDMINRFIKAQFDLSGDWSTERFAKERAQNELAEASDKIKRLKSVVGEL